MINGVVQIIAAVLFAVVHLSTEMGSIWLWIAAAYLVIGIANLIFYVLKSKHQLHVARKEAKKKTGETAKTSVFANGITKPQELKPIASEKEDSIFCN